MQKSQRNVNFKGIKLALKNLGRFLSLTDSRAVLRDKIKIIKFCVKKEKIKVD
jgi:hypothetical protein